MTCKKHEFKIITDVISTPFLDSKIYLKRNKKICKKCGIASTEAKVEFIDEQQYQTFILSQERKNKLNKICGHAI